MGDSRGRVWVLLAPTKAAAGLALHPLLPPDERDAMRPESAARYVAPLSWCPAHEVLWFHVHRGLPPRVLHPGLVPAGAWPRIGTLAAPTEPDREWPCSRGEGPERVDAVRWRQLRGDGGAEGVTG